MTGRAWWTLEEIESTDEVIWPSRLVPLVRAYLRDGAPVEPIRIGA